MKTLREYIDILNEINDRAQSGSNDKLDDPWANPEILNRPRPGATQPPTAADAVGAAGHAAQTSKIQSLTAAEAQSLLKLQGRGRFSLPSQTISKDLYLNGLKNLDPEVAEVLAQHRGDDLYLNGLTEISDRTAEALSHHRGAYLYLNGLTSLSDRAAWALAQYKGTLYLRGLRKLSDFAREALASHGGVIINRL